MTETPRKESGDKKARPDYTRVRVGSAGRENSNDEARGRMESERPKEKRPNRDRGVRPVSTTDQGRQSPFDSPGLLAELADAMDSKSVAAAPEPLENKPFPHAPSPACPMLDQNTAPDPAAAALVRLLPRLDARQLRQLLALAESMAG